MTSGDDWKSFQSGDRVEVVHESNIVEADGDVRETIRAGTVGTIVKPPFGKTPYVELWFDRSGPHSIYGMPAAFLKFANPLDRLAGA